MRRLLTAGTSGLALILAASAGLAQQATSDGAPQQAFNNSCRTCHTVKEGDNRLGPNLHKIIGRKAGSLSDYAYSSAMKDAGFAWDQDKLTQFITNPDQVVSGNRMKPYTGLSADEAGKVIAYLQSASGQP
ncbi:c-type cytochrome [Bradyrhizobium manausense]|uniref:c-type cytochrome n=1 Tax=Bradyrhizobium TaxID=374 RepID=UPI001BA8CCF2|nr:MULTISPECIES: c-type cytochrome [Bradyrhizobium]MBR0825944.1 c-type cytochrome [Bradyrhizobium manausense]UVO31122.1 c-type cytochrome [Bradyrhizobium arachidis]